MEVFKAKGQLVYQSNLTRNKSREGLLHVNTQSAIIVPEEKNEAVTLAIDMGERLNYINAIHVQNEKLKEISWIQSHLVRGPLARIMGLVQVIGDLKDNDEIGEILEYILLSANELDNVIREISDKSGPVLI